MTNSPNNKNPEGHVIKETVFWQKYHSRLVALWVIFLFFTALSGIWIGFLFCIGLGICWFGRNSILPRPACVSIKDGSPSTVSSSRKSMRKIVINTCEGDFALNRKGVEMYAKLKGFKIYSSKLARKHDGKLDTDNYVPCDDKRLGDGEGIYHRTPLKNGKIDWGNRFNFSDIPRDDPDLIELVEKYGTDISSVVARLEVVEIRDDAEWEIKESGGKEWLIEKRPNVPGQDSLQKQHEVGYSAEPTSD